MTIEQLNEQAERVLAEVERAVVGKREALELVLLGMLADGHVLQSDLVAERNVLHARQRDRSIFVEDEAGQRRAGGNAFDHYDRDGILGIMQHAMDQSRLPWPHGRRQGIILPCAREPSEVEARLPDRTKAQPVLRTRAVPRERGQMVRRAVSLVVRETIGGIAAIELDQLEIADSLGEDRRGRYRCDATVAANDAACN